MTLRSRNRIYFAFFILSTVIFTGVVGSYIFAAIEGVVMPPADPFRNYNLFPSSIIFSYNYYASIAGIMLFSIYTPIVAFSIFTGFEKTQSIEVMYFLLFLTGCLCENFRIFIPINALWKTTSTLSLCIGRVVIMGRMLSPLSLLFAALFSENDHRENTERNILIVLVISIISGLLIPLDTYHTTSTLTILWGTRTLFTTVRIIIALSTFAALLVNAITKFNEELRTCTIGYSILITGYALLCVADCWFLLAAGSISFAIGTFYYLKSIHGLYLWR